MWFVIGLFAGATIGFFAAGLCAVAKDDESEGGNDERLFGADKGTDNKSQRKQ